MQRWYYILIITLLCHPVWAQNDADTSGDIEKILKSEQAGGPQQEEDESPEKPDVPWGAENVDPKELSDLGRLAPFSDIAVIQKRFLPKTGRFEFFPSAGAIINDVFFFSPILSGRFGYAFNEKYGLEAQVFVSSKSERQVVRNLRSRDVITEGLIFPQSYYGVDFKWTPVYGKMGFFNKAIIPFDQYFTLGGGVTNTNQKTSPTTIHLGLGQIYASSKWLALRWDVSFYWFSSSTAVGSAGSGSFMNLHFTLGASFFFPEAKYR